MTPWIVIGAVAIGSYLFRISMLVLAARIGVPAILERVARFAVPTAFVALAATSLSGYAAHGSSAIAPYVAVAVAVIAVRRTGSSHAALLVGLPILWIVSAFWS
jgi:branched-subunit amino acid transport protein